MSTVPAQIDRFVAADRDALRIYLVFFCATLVIGIAIAVVGFVREDPAQDMQGLWLKLGGVGVASLGSFPLKEWLSLRGRISQLRHVKETWQELSSQASPPEAELQRLRDLVWKLFEKRTLS